MFSPAFVYHQMNNGQDNESEFSDAIQAVVQTGASYWSEMPFSYEKFDNYPDEDAWRGAASNRQEAFDDDKEYLYMRCNTMKDIAYLKNLMDRGYLIAINVDPYQFANLSLNDAWYTWNYNPSTCMRSSVMVGYDDLTF